MPSLCEQPRLMVSPCMVLIVCRVPLRWQLLLMSAYWLSILTFLHPRDELQLVTVVLGEESLQYGSELLAPFLPADQQQQQGPTITPVVSVDSFRSAAMLPP